MPSLTIYGQPVTIYGQPVSIYGADVVASAGGSSRRQAALLLLRRRLAPISTVISADVPPDERAIFADILERLESLTTTDGTPVFDAVQLVESPASVEASSDWAAYAVVWRIGGEDIDDAMSGDEFDVVRRATYGVQIQVTSLESGDRAAAVVRAVNLIKGPSLLNNVCLGDTTMPSFTRIRRDATATGAQAIGTTTLTGEYAFLAPANNFAELFQD